MDIVQKNIHWGETINHYNSLFIYGGEGKEGRQGRREEEGINQPVKLLFTQYPNDYVETWSRRHSERVPQSWEIGKALFWGLHLLYWTLPMHYFQMSWAPWDVRSELLWNQDQTSTDIACTMDLPLLFLGKLLSTVQKSMVVLPTKLLLTSAQQEPMAKRLLLCCLRGTQLWSELNKPSHKVPVRWSMNSLIRHSGRSNLVKDSCTGFPSFFSSPSCITAPWDPIPKRTSCKQDFVPGPISGVIQIRHLLLEYSTVFLIMGIYRFLSFNFNKINFHIMSKCFLKDSCSKATDYGQTENAKAWQ